MLVFKKHNKLKFFVQLLNGVSCYVQSQLTSLRDYEFKAFYPSRLTESISHRALFCMKTRLRATNRCASNILSGHVSYEVLLLKDLPL